MVVHSLIVKDKRSHKIVISTNYNIRIKNVFEQSSCENIVSMIDPLELE